MNLCGVINERCDCDQTDSCGYARFGFQPSVPCAGSLHFQINGIDDLFREFRPILLDDLYKSITGIELPMKPQVKTMFKLLLGLECGWLAIADMCRDIMNRAAVQRRAKGQSTHDLRVLLHFFDHKLPLEVRLHVHKPLITPYDCCDPVSEISVLILTYAL